MRKFSLQKIGVLLMIVVMPIAVFAQTSTNPTELIKQLQTLLNEYSEKIRRIEAENMFLKEQIAKNNIKISLDELNAAIAKANTSSVSSTTATAIVNTGGSISNLPINANASDLQKNFIKQFRLDWPDIRKAYVMPEDARIGLYEFVKNDEGNSVFVNIAYGNGPVETAYHAKLLYSFDKQNFKRTLIGFFLYNNETKGYKTLRGTNPFAGMERDRVFEASVSIPTTNTQTVASNTLNSASATPQNTVTQNTTTPTTTSQPIIANSEAIELEKQMKEAYFAKNYARVFTLSDPFLKNNAPTYEILFHRYRSYYAQGQYEKALSEIKKMENAKLADEKIYCDAYAIHYVTRNTSLANTYKNLAGPKCKLTP